MTRGSIVEYVRAVRSRYLAAKKMGKGLILDEFVKVTGYHRKAAVRLLRRQGPSQLMVSELVPTNVEGVKPTVTRRGRPARYKEVIQPLKALWEASDRLCSKRLQPFIPEMVKVLRRHGEQPINASMEERLCQMSAATMVRFHSP